MLHIKLDQWSSFYLIKWRMQRIMKTFKTILLITSFFISSLGWSQNKELIYDKDFSELPLEILESRYWSSNYTSDNYEIKMQGSQILVDKKKYLRPKKVNVSLVENKFGGILGVDSGEWMGGLYDISGYGVPRLIEKMNVRFLRKLDDSKVSFFDANVSKSKFKIYDRDPELSINEGNKFQEVATLDDIPMYIFHDENDNLYVFGAKNLYKLVDKSFNPILKNGLWQNIEPYNVVHKSINSILVGVKGGIVEINSQNGEFHLFVEKK